MSLKLYPRRNKKISKKPTHQRLQNRVFSSDSEQEKTLSTYSRQKKVSRILWMDEPVEDVPSIPYDIDGTTVFKVKAKNRLELLDALKDGRKWKKDSRTEWSGLCPLDIEIVREVIHVPTPIVSFINNLSMATVQTSRALFCFGELHTMSSPEVRSI